MDGGEVRLSRRGFVGGASLALSGSVAGCLDLFTAQNPELGQPVQLTVKSLPSDEDPAATGIARRLTENLVDVGADATLVPKSAPELSRDILIENDYDIFVANYPGVFEPDELRTLLHSSFRDERGWQNPFGFEDAELDGLLDQQKVTDAPERNTVIAEIQRRIIDALPFSVVAIPDELTAVADHLPPTIAPAGLSTPFDIFRLGTEIQERQSGFRIGILDGRITFDHNPLTPSFPLQSVLTGLLYDPLFAHVDGTYIPWLATERTWSEEDDRIAFEVTLHEAVRWHDGTPLTAEDIEFTYRFMDDLSLGSADLPIPAPRFRGRSSVVEAVDVVDDRTVRFEMDTVGRDIASRSLTVPILPQHIWEPRHELDANGLPVALTTDNEAPVGSGAYMYDDSAPNESLLLERNSAHFLEFETPISPSHTPFESIPFNRIEFRMPTRPPTVGTALSLIDEGELDIIARVPAHAAPSVSRSDHASLEARPSNKFYMIGFNTTRAPCSDVVFRRLVGRLVDRTFVVALIFRGYATPADSPLAMTEFIPSDLQWEGESALGTFPGSSGILDQEEARSIFIEAGFELDNEQLSLRQSTPD